MFKKLIFITTDEWDAIEFSASYRVIKDWSLTRLNLREVTWSCSK